MFKQKTKYNMGIITAFILGGFSADVFNHLHFLPLAQNILFLFINVGFLYIAYLIESTEPGGER